MELRELIEALMSYDTLAARQGTQDVLRESTQWSTIPQPEGLGAEALAVAAGIVEMLAQRTGQDAPASTSNVAESPTRIYLVRAAASMPPLRRLCEQQGPEPLRKRQILAPPEFLTVA